LYSSSVECPFFEKCDRDNPPFFFHAFLNVSVAPAFSLHAAVSSLVDDDSRLLFLAVSGSSLFHLRTITGSILPRHCRRSFIFIILTEFGLYSKGKTARQCVIFPLLPATHCSNFGGFQPGIFPSLF